ncbi:MAG: winged helix-turn-helix transcriptional regulator [Ignavibacteriae bacterium]|nr:winged helix-turn-helix transcriptional regulator [Ignavibacteriota bacterium]MCB0753813.1 winged helix-turn-helix transcriptional regulator [Ignavibacteriota bacterium]MCB9249229.1 winged helix-turn-helix transcriptional regulator [Ignavibacteriales bacterium]MCB9250187.1 winged helix-turn-helix transcriptional regulator [Ignavibacteriales bacterium]
MTNLFKFGTPSESNGFLLWKTTNLWQREIKKTLKKFDLTHTQFVILASSYWLTNQNENITQVEIAEFIDIDKMMTSNVIRKLIEKKLLKRKEHKTDTRAKVINLTDKGLDTLKNSIKEVESFDVTFFGKLADKDEFSKELLRLLNNNGG